MNKRLSRSASIFGVEGLEARRLLSGGVPDFNFGTDGRIVRTNEYAQLGGVIELSDGDYLVGGATYGLNAQGADSVAFLERFNPDGSLDTAFGTNGRLLITGGNEDTTIHGIIELPGGKLLLRTRMSDGPLQLLRINADGSVDGTFGFGGFGEYGRGAVALQSDGKILVIENNIVRRLTEDGLLDTTFGTNGSVILWEQFVWDSSYATSHNVLIDSNDRIIISADAQVTENFSTTYRAGLARLGVNGAIDTAWGDDGFAFVNYGGDEFFNTTDLVRSAAGDYYLLINQDDGEHLIVKFDGDGVLDSSYGNEINRDGAWLLQVDRYGNTGELTSLIFQPDGKLLVRGSGARQDGIILPLTLRLNTDGTRDLTWG
ncbi:MAG TPA: hypothetical protein PKB10_06755, partial [Tepidisphaeraceae bacterium]|nr:hypothetical protein [Tepidisphaeraceae bacterium]